MLKKIFLKTYSLLHLLQASSFSLLSLFLFSPLCAHSGNATLDPLEFRAQIKQMAQDVPEFAWIAKTAESHGLKAWIFGGTASTFAHYVKDSMLWEKNGQELYGEFFKRDVDGNLDYNNIFHPTQDIDVVVDGKMAHVVAFERDILARFPKVDGERNKWEVRALREGHGDKEALLDNFDFLGQHTDSHSVGAISLGHQTSLGEVVKDLFHWKAEDNPFLQDVLSGDLHYYVGPRHRETARYKEGLNPEIFSVVRYFIKLFQHGLSMGEEDKRQLKKVIEDFSPTQINETNGYVKNWIKGNVPKLFLHSRDLEYAWNTLEKMGLRAKLLEIGGKDKEGDPAWWMSKSPLRSFPLGAGEGRTAQERGIKTVAHDTKNFLVWTAMISSRKGIANVFESRDDVTGERASFGKGFYTLKNKTQGLWQTGYSIQFSMNPRAREGSDFEIFRETILVLNRDALSIIPKSLELGTLKDYFDLAQNGRKQWGGYIERERTRLNKKYWNAHWPKVDSEMTELIAFLKREESDFFWGEWFKLKVSVRFPELVEELLAHENVTYQKMVAVRVLSQEHWNNRPDWVRELIRKGNQHILSSVAHSVLSHEHWKDHPELVEALISRSYDNELALQAVVINVLGKEHWKDRFKWAEKIIENGSHGALAAMAEHIFPKKFWKDHPELVSATIARGNQFVFEQLIYHTLSQEHWKNRYDWVEELIERGGPNSLWRLAKYVFSKKYWRPNGKLLAKIIEKGDQRTLQTIALDVLSQKQWSGYPHLLKEVMARGDLDVLWTVAQNVLSLKLWSDSPELVEDLIFYAYRVSSNDSYIWYRDFYWTSIFSEIQHLLSREHWKNHPRLMEISKGEVSTKNLSKVIIKGSQCAW